MAGIWVNVVTCVSPVVFSLQCSFEDASVRALLQPLELALRKTLHTYCGRSYGLFIKQLARSVRDRSTRLPRAT